MAFTILLVGYVVQLEDIVLCLCLNWVERKDLYVYCRENK